ncbi:hypothetical protein GXW83_25230 [Streptacidiphilus sp. PB12-B1b]|uniref:DUF6286 domain-containing protein n=1 Tax=Streptacidiphilus sp. PB12-B1b TaxID=2705012 RepID=UPI0015F83323|nr:DUF6286 domain-containing protein [Streptacidiphilus sp. PB12-B1b]QMU78521.1 hypothetical protein GXW83_25230 [Streptacidiphilus sp. PB12-B1b]
MSTPVTPAPPAADAPPADGRGAAPARPRRYWSVRRNASAVVALVGLFLAGAVLYEEIYVHTGHAAHSWRKAVTNYLAEHTLNDSWVIAGAAVACVLGLWLLVLAATPGLRALLPMDAAGTTGMRAALDRGAVASVLHRATLEVPGVSSAAVRAGRRKAVIRAGVRFGEHEQARDALVSVLSAERDRLGLVRPPTIKVRVRGSR